MQVSHISGGAINQISKGEREILNIIYMYRHLYRNPTVLSKVLIKEYTNIKSEELAFRYAALAKLRTQELDFEALH